MGRIHNSTNAFFSLARYWYEVFTVVYGLVVTNLCHGIVGHIKWILSIQSNFYIRMNHESTSNYILRNLSTLPFGLIHY